MPIRKVKGGWKWGSRGKVYKSRVGAERQARAAYANGYRGDAAKQRRLAVSRGDAAAPAVELPPDHKPGMRVPGGPDGGARCSTCQYLNADGVTCSNEYFIRWNGSSTIPAPSDEYCSDWYED